VQFIFQLVTGRIKAEDDMKTVLMQIWDDVDIKILESGFLEHQKESFYNVSPETSQRNLFFVQGFLSLTSSGQDQPPDDQVESDQDVEEGCGGGVGGGGGSNDCSACDFAVVEDPRITEKISNHNISFHYDSLINDITCSFRPWTRRRTRPIIALFSWDKYYTPTKSAPKHKEG